MITATKAGAWQHAVCPSQSLPSATFFPVSDTSQLTLSAALSDPKEKPGGEGRSWPGCFSRDTVIYWVDRSLATSHRPQGDSEQRPLNQFILEIVFFLRQREEGGT